MKTSRLAAALPTFTAIARGRRVRAAAGAASRFARRAARAALLPPVLGAAYLLTLAAVDASAPAVSDRELVLGDDASHKLAWVIVRYAAQLRRFEIELACTAVAAGAALGGIAWGLAAAAARLRRKGPLPRVALAAHAAALVAWLHGGIFAWSMAKAPQLYEAAWYARGGWRRALQRAVVGAPSPPVFLAIAAGGAAAYLAASAMAGGRTLADLRAAFAGLRGARARRAAIGLLAAAGALAVAAAIPSPGAGRRAAAPGRPNILVLAADSLRDDHVNGVVTPHIAALARRGTRFTRAYVSIARTFPSWTTILTGRYPHHHGIRTTLPRREVRDRPFDTIAARLRDAGWATAVVADYGGDIFHEADLGFETIEAPRLDFVEYLGVRVFEQGLSLLPLLRSRAGRALFSPMREMPKAADAGYLAADAVAAVHRLAGRPFFLVVFFAATHFPYAAPAPYFERFTDPSYSGDYPYDKPAWYTDRDPDARDVAQIRGLYAGAAASVDAAAARVLAAVDREGIADRTIVVATADHGEDLFDGGRWHGHGDHLFGDEQNHVPLVVFDPRRPAATGPREVTDLVRDVDLAPTLADLAGVASPALGDGRSLVPALAGERLVARPIFAETGMWMGGVKGFPGGWRIAYPSYVDTAEVDAAHHDEIVLKREYVPLIDFAKHRMVFDGRWKLVYMPAPGGPRYALFDALADPENTVDLSAAEPKELARLKAELWRWMLEDPRMEDRRGWLAPRGVHVDAVDGPAAR